MYVTERQAAERLGLSVDVLRRWRSAGSPPRFYKFGGSVRYALADLEAFEEAAAQTSTKEPKPSA